MKGPPVTLLQIVIYSLKKKIIIIDDIFHLKAAR